MSSRTARVTSWVVAVILLLASGWSFNIATYNWFAAGNVPMQLEMAAKNASIALLNGRS